MAHADIHVVLSESSEDDDDDDQFSEQEPPHNNMKFMVKFEKLMKTYKLVKGLHKKKKSSPLYMKRSKSQGASSSKRGRRS